MIYVVFLAMLAALSGCYSLGTKVEQAQVAQFERGRTSCDSVKAALGVPNATIVRADGSCQLVYNHLQMQLRPIGLLIGGPDTAQTQWIFECNPSGILTTYASTEGQLGTQPGLLNGSKP